MTFSLLKCAESLFSELQLCSKTSAALRQERDDAQAQGNVFLPGSPEETKYRQQMQECEEKIQIILLGLDVALGPGLLDRALEVSRSKPSYSNSYSSSSSHGKRITAYVSEPSQRRCWHVQGDAGVYLCVEGFCSCRNFCTKLTSGVPLCKHLIAIKLATALEEVNTVVVPDAQYARLLCA
mmetsp:Transcript_20315/g.37750  ORF Transcript_20315/g.37750 Transcript_20315/m.37750 type:complete len:181 (+) Transcript_20315:404-946(+)